MNARVKRTCIEVIAMITAAVIVALLANSLSPAGIPLIGQWNESRGVVRADAGSDGLPQGFEIERISQAAAVYSQGGALFVDVRPSPVFEEGHVKGAVNLPLAGFDTHIDDFLTRVPPTQPIVAYCSGRTCEDSHQVARMLMDFGYESVRVMIDGFPGWKAEGLPIE